jgi:hypothetical protein
MFKLFQRTALNRIKFCLIQHFQHALEAIKILPFVEMKKGRHYMSSFKLNLNESTTITIKLKLSYIQEVAATICFNEKRLLFSECVVFTYKRKKLKGNWKEKDLICCDLEWFQLQTAITGIKKRKLSNNFLLITQPE